MEEGGPGGAALLVTHRFAARKHHKLRGTYPRVFAVGPGGFLNEDPISGSVTNRWSYEQLLDVQAPDNGGEAVASESGELEFRLVIQESPGAFGSSRSTLVFSSPCRAELLCTLRANKLVGQKKAFAFLKLRRSRGGERKAWLIPGESGLVEVDAQGAGPAHAQRVLRAYRFVDMRLIARLATPRGSGFVLQVGREKRPHAFVGDDALPVLQALVRSCRAAGIEPPTDADLTPLDLDGWRGLCALYERQAGIGGAPLLEVAAHKRRSGRAVRLQLTPTHLVELDAGAVLSVRSVGRLRALVRPSDGAASELDLLFTGDEVVAEYDVAQRELLAAHLCDAAALRGTAVALLSARPRLALRVCPAGTPVPADFELLAVRRFLASVAALAERDKGGSQRGSLLGVQLTQGGLSQRLSLVCTELLENSAVPLQAATLQQLSQAEITGPGTNALLSLACGLLASLRAATPAPGSGTSAGSGHVSSAGGGAGAGGDGSGEVSAKPLLLALDCAHRLAARFGAAAAAAAAAAGNYWQAGQTPEVLSLLVTALQPSNDALLLAKALSLLFAMLGGGTGEAKRDRTVEHANKQFLLCGAGGELMRLLAGLPQALLQKSSEGGGDEAALAVVPLLNVLERVLVSGRESTPADVHALLVSLLAVRPQGLVGLASYRIPSALDALSLVVHALVADPPSAEAASAIQREALRNGLFLWQLHAALFGPRAGQRLQARFLVAALARRCEAALDLLRRVLPFGLFEALRHPVLSLAEQAGLRQLVSEGTGVAGEGGGAGSAGADAGAATGDDADAAHAARVAERIELALRVRAAQLPPGQALQLDRLPAAAPPLPAAAASSGAESLDVDALVNFDVMFHMSEQDSELPDLIWNATTRGELRQALESEIQALAGSSWRWDTDMLSWNHHEFAVSYASLARETRVGGCFLRLMLDEKSESLAAVEKALGEHGPQAALLNNSSAGDSAQRAVEQVRQPAAFLAALHLSYLRAAASGDTGGAVACLRVMHKVTLAHARALAPFQDATFLLATAARASDRALRDRALLLVEALARLNQGTAALLALRSDEALPALLELVDLAHVSSEVAEEEDGPAEWFYRKAKRDTELRGPGETAALGSSGPLTLWQLREAVKAGALRVEETECWAAGQPGWRPMGLVAQLRWSGVLGSHCIPPPGESNSNQTAALLALSVLRAMVNARAPLQGGRSLVPPPRGVRALASADVLACAARCLLAPSAQVVKAAAELLGDLAAAASRPPGGGALRELFLTGAFEFAFAPNCCGAAPAAVAVARLLHLTHRSQATPWLSPPQPQEQRPRSPRSSQSQHSPLALLLPPSMVLLLERHGPAKFAEVLGGDFSTPEFIWTRDMRSHLAEVMGERVAPALARLRQNSRAPLQWSPPPRVFYPALDHEFWCGGYYLRNLCAHDESQSSPWPVAEPAELLAAVLHEWHLETTRARARSASFVGAAAGPAAATTSPVVAATAPLDSAARAVLGGLPPDASPQQVRAAYRAAAEPLFAVMLKAHLQQQSPQQQQSQQETEAASSQLALIEVAYETLAHRGGLNGGNEGADPVTVRLLIKTQSVLLARHAEQLRDVQYTAFPLLVKGLDGSDDVTLVASELVFKICFCAPGNAEELVGAGGVELLVEALARHLDRAEWPEGEGEAGPGPGPGPGPSSGQEALSPPPNVHARVVANAMHSLVGLASLRSARERLAAPAACTALLGALQGLLRVRPKRAAPQSVVQFALQVAARVAVEPTLQEALVRGGLLWRAAALVFTAPAAAAAEEDVKETRSAPAREAALKATAKHAARALSRLAGLLTSKDLATPEHPQAQRALERLLSPPVAKLLRAASPAEFLVTVNCGADEPVETAQVIWDARMRETAQQYLRGAAEQQEQPGEPPLALHARLAHEPWVGGVYLAVFARKPDPALLGNAPAFAVALLQSLPLDKPELLLTYLGALKGVFAGGDLAALSNALVLSEPPVLDVLRDLVQRPGAARAPAIALLAAAAGASTAIAATVAHWGLLTAWLLAEDREPDAQAGADLLHLAARLCGFSRVVASLLEHDVLRVLLKLALRGATSQAAQAQAAQAAQALAACCRDETHGGRCCRTLHAWLPAGLVLLLREQGGAALLETLPAEHIATPELLWGAPMLRRLVQDVELGAHETKYPELQSELAVGTVLVRLFLDDPARPLRDAGRFFRAALTAFMDECEQRAAPTPPAGFEAAFASASSSEHAAETELTGEQDDLFAAPAKHYARLGHAHEGEAIIQGLAGLQAPPPPTPPKRPGRRATLPADAPPADAPPPVPARGAKPPPPPPPKQPLLLQQSQQSQQPQQPQPQPQQEQQRQQDEAAALDSRLETLSDALAALAQAQPRALSEGGSAARCPLAQRLEACLRGAVEAQLVEAQLDTRQGSQRALLPPTLRVVHALIAADPAWAKSLAAPAFDALGKLFASERAAAAPECLSKAAATLVAACAASPEAAFRLGQREVRVVVACAKADSNMAALLGALVAQGNLAALKETGALSLTVRAGARAEGTAESAADPLAGEAHLGA